MEWFKKIWERFINWKNTVNIPWPIVAFISAALSMIFTAFLVVYAQSFVIQLGFLITFSILAYRLVRKLFPGSEPVPPVK